MRRSDAPWVRLRAEGQRRRAFFTRDVEAICAMNARNVSVACWFAATLALMTVVAVRLIDPAWRVSPAHLLFVPVATLLGIGARVFTGRISRPWAEAAIEVGAAAIVLGWIAVLDTVFSPAAPGVIMQPACVAAATLIATPWGLPVWVALAAEGAFAALSVAIKTAPAVQTDLTAAVIGSAVAVALSQFVLDLRLHDFVVRERYRVLSERDPLTGLLNRGALSAYIEEELAGGRAERGVCVLMMDIDDFKHVNDRFGHDAGDELLRDMGAALIGSFRSRDAVARFGGDEFVVFAPGLTNLSVAVSKFEAVSQRISEAGFRHIGETVSCSCGAVVVPPGPVDARALMRQADQALYDVKRSGKGACEARCYERPEPAHERRGELGA